MPRDISTQWNSTFDMLNFAIEYQIAIDVISADCEMDLQQFELSEHEWKIAMQLCDMLKVRSCAAYICGMGWELQGFASILHGSFCHIVAQLHSIHFTDLKGCNPLF